MAYRNHDHLGMHVPLGSVGGAIEEPFQHVQHCKYGSSLQYGPAVGNRVDALIEGFGEDVDGHVSLADGGTGRLQGRGSIVAR